MKFSSIFLILCCNTVCKAISNRTTLPILENLYMELNKDKITLRGNDLNWALSINRWLMLVSIWANWCVLKANTLQYFIETKLETIDIELNDSLKCNIKSSAIDFDIYGL